MSIPIIDTLKPLGAFPAANAEDISCGNKRLDVVLEDKVNSSDMAALQKAVNQKVEQVPGKSLSTNDYTNEDKSKVDRTAEEVARLASYFTVIS